MPQYPVSIQGGANGSGRLTPQSCKLWCVNAGSSCDSRSLGRAQIAVRVATPFWLVHRRRSNDRQVFVPPTLG